MFEHTQPQPVRTLVHDAGYGNASTVSSHTEKLQIGSTVLPECVCMVNEEMQSSEPGQTGFRKAGFPQVITVGFIQSQWFNQEGFKT